MPFRNYTAIFLRLSVFSDPQNIQGIRALPCRKALYWLALATTEYREVHASVHRRFRPSDKRKTTPDGMVFLLGATRNRTGDKGFADLCLTAWLWRRMFFFSLTVKVYHNKFKKAIGEGKKI